MIVFLFMCHSAGHRCTLRQHSLLFSTRGLLKGAHLPALSSPRALRFFFPPLWRDTWRWRGRLVQFGYSMHGTRQLLTVLAMERRFRQCKLCTPAQLFLLHKNFPG